MNKHTGKIIYKRCEKLKNLYLTLGSNEFYVYPETGNIYKTNIDKLRDHCKSFSSKLRKSKNTYTKGLEFKLNIITTPEGNFHCNFIIQYRHTIPDYIIKKSVEYRIKKYPAFVELLYFQIHMEESMDESFLHKSPSGIPKSLSA